MDRGDGIYGRGALRRGYASSAHGLDVVVLMRCGRTIVSDEIESWKHQTSAVNS